MNGATLTTENTADTGEFGASATARGIPGNMAIWVGILSEMTEFALMFVVYFIAKAHNPESSMRARCA